MTRRRRRLLPVLAVAAVVAAMVAIVSVPRPGDGCGPMIPEAVFVVTRHPDVPDSVLVTGRLGVIQPTWRQRYLYVAYRCLRGMPPDSLRQPPLRPDPNRAASAWLEARNAVPGVTPIHRIDPYRTSDYSGGWAWFLNLYADAFDNATRTLAARIERFGAASPEVHDWVAAQDRVFESAADTLVRPAATASGAPELVRADRAYQTAAAEFYAGGFDGAVAGFEAISRDPESPWRTLAPYLVARALTRQGTMGGSDGAPDTAALAAAQRQVKRVLDDPALAGTHEAARGLGAFIRFRLEPRARLRELCVALTAPGAARWQDLEDFTIMLDHFDQATVESLATADPAYDLADWILTLQSGSAAAHRHALSRLAEAPYWTVVAIARAHGVDPESPGLIEATSRATPGEPAYPTLAWHRVRLMIESGRTDEARATLDQLLAGPREPWPPSSWNLLRAARLSVARTLKTFLAYTPRDPAGLSYGMPFEGFAPDSTTLMDRAYPGRRCMDQDAAAVFRRALPLDALATIAHGSDLPTNLRAEVAFTTWVRAILLDRHDVAVALAPVVASLVPSLAARLEAFASAPDADAWRFAAADLMLHVPGARPAVMVGLGRQTALDRSDPYRDNWWCATGGGRDLIFARGPFGLGPWSRADTVSAGFIDEVQRAAAADEAARLAAIPAGPTWLARRTIEWAEGHRDDPRVPEALHLAVEATHYGCPDDDTSELSRRAFQLLHQRYPESSWTKETPYWY